MYFFIFFLLYSVSSATMWHKSSTFQSCHLSSHHVFFLFISSFILKWCLKNPSISSRRSGFFSFATFVYFCLYRGLLKCIAFRLSSSLLVLGYISSAYNNKLPIHIFIQMFCFLSMKIMLQIWNTVCSSSSTIWHVGGTRYLMDILRQYILTGLRHWPFYKVISVRWYWNAIHQMNFITY